MKWDQLMSITNCLKTAGRLWDHNGVLIFEISKLPLKPESLRGLWQARLSGVGRYKRRSQVTWLRVTLSPCPAVF